MLRGDALSDAIRSHPENGSNDSDSEEEEEEDLEFHDVEAVDATQSRCSILIGQCC